MTIASALLKRKFKKPPSGGFFIGRMEVDISENFI
jgi:hypothetical protein